MIGRCSFILVAATSLTAILLGCDRNAPFAPILQAGVKAGPTVNGPSNTGAIAASSSRIDVSWQDNSSNETGFEIWRSSGGAAFAILSTAGANVTTYGDAGLGALLRYCYQVRALRTYDSKISYSTFSNTACASTTAPPPPPPPPPPPTVPTAPTLQSVYASPWVIGVSWLDNSDNEDGFKIERCEGFDCTDADFIVISVTGASTYPSRYYQDGDVVGGVAYSYRIRAFNGAGASAPSIALGAFACIVAIMEDGEYYCL
jgi:titin